MRVVMLIASFRPATEGGSEKQCRLFAGELATRGHDITVLTRVPGPPAPRRERVDGYDVRRVGIGHPLSDGIRKLGSRLRGRPTATAVAKSAPAATNASGNAGGRSVTAPFLWFEYLCFLAAAAFWVWRRRSALDLIHAHESHWIAGFAVWLGGRLGLPVLVKEASNPVLMRNATPVPGRERFYRLRLAAAFMAQTDAARRDLIAAGVEAQRIRVVPNAVAMPGERGHPAAACEVLYVGNLHQSAAWKAFDVLFAAWIAVVRERPSARLIVVGSGDPAPWRARLAEAGAADSVQFQPAVADLSPWYARAAMLVLPSRREGLPNAVLEAQSWGLPVVVSDIPGCVASVLPDRTALVVPVGEAAPLAAAIRTLLDDPARRAAMGEAARNWIGDRFAMARVTDELERWYREVVAADQTAVLASGRGDGMREVSVKSEKGS